jgi:hypothetical protein
MNFLVNKREHAGSNEGQSYDDVHTIEALRSRDILKLVVDNEFVETPPVQSDVPVLRVIEGGSDAERRVAQALQQANEAHDEIRRAG